jgi:hypothetical protein
MSLKRSNLSESDRHAEWLRIINRINQEHIGQGWSHYVFRLFRAVFNFNEDLRSLGGFLLNAIAEMYVTHSLMVLRRELDRQGGTENLINLLYDIKANPHILTRARFLETWDADGPVIELAERQFSEWSPVAGPAGRDTDYINPEVIQGDLDVLTQALEKVRQYAERTRAHRTPELDPSVSVTFNEMHSAFRLLRSAINKYYALLTASSMAQWEPVPQYSVVAPFKFAWLPDDPQVLEAVIKEVEAESVDDV